MKVAPLVVVSLDQEFGPLAERLRVKAGVKRAEGEGQGHFNLV